MEQQEKHDSLEWEHLLGYNKIDDLVNMIIATVKILPPPINIY